MSLFAIRIDYVGARGIAGSSIERGAGACVELTELVELFRGEEEGVERKRGEMEQKAGVSYSGQPSSLQLQFYTLNGERQRSSE